MFNQYNNTPALTGFKSCPDIHLGYRYRDIGSEGSPRFGYLSATGQFKSKSRKFISTKHGLGGMFIRDDIGPFSTTKFQLSYAAHFPINRDMVLSLGVSLGIGIHTFDISKASTVTPDPLIQNSSNSSVLFPDMRVGVWIKDRKWYAGLSFNQIIPMNWGMFDAGARSNIHMYATGGYHFHINEQWSFIPSTMLRADFRTWPSWDIDAVFDFRNTFSFGLGYRVGDAAKVLFKYNFLKWVSLAYAFDFTYTKLGLQSAFTHEIGLIVQTCRNQGKKSTNCPTFN